MQKRALPQRPPAPPAVHDALRASAGRPLDERTRGAMESRFAHDFTRVPAHGEPEGPVDVEAAAPHDFRRARIHTGRHAADAANRVDADAFTFGRDVFFAAGRYAPETPAGRKLLAHELTHVAQQEHAPPVVQRGFLDDVGALFGISEGSFSKEELLLYLRKLRDTKTIEDSYDSDNKARVLVRVWKTGDRDFALDAELKKLLVREMWTGYTSAGDQDGILDLLERSESVDLPVIFGPGGVTPEQLLGSFDDARAARLRTLIAQGSPAMGGQLNDETFRKKWDAKLHEGLQLLKSATAIAGPDGRPTAATGCAFPGTYPGEGPDSRDRYDAARWGIDVREEVQGIRAYVPKTARPHEAVDALFDHLHEWSCDCGRYVEVAWLYAWRHALEPQQFDRKFAGLHFRWDDTTAMSRERITAAAEPEADPNAFAQYGGAKEIEGYQGSPKKDLNAVWERLPVGTRVMWRNPACEGHRSWERENAIKVSMKGPGGVALYDAQGLGHGLTEEEVKAGMARACPTYMITDAVLAELRARFQLPRAFLDRLAEMKGARYQGKDRFTVVLREPAQALQQLRETDPAKYHEILRVLFDKAKPDPQTLAEIARQVYREHAQIPQ